MTISKPTRLTLSLAWAILIGSATFAVHSFGDLSQHAVLILLQIACMYLIVPGLIVARAVFGSLQPLSLATAAIVNAAVHYGLSWFALGFLFAEKRRSVEERLKSRGQSN